jgi:hypothetical protein
MQIRLSQLHENAKPILIDEAMNVLYDVGVLQGLQDAALPQGIHPLPVIEDVDLLECVREPTTEDVIDLPRGTTSN